jgi:peptidoglycan/LPS O-acetylase OafA/YrhL
VWPAAIAACVLVRSAAGGFVGASDVMRTGWVVCLLLGWAAPRIRELPDGWVQRASAVVAKYSYGIYLSHGVVLWAAFVALKGAPLAVRIAVWAIGTAGLPVVCFHAIENPMVELGVRITKRRRANARVVAIDNGALSYARQVR